MVRPYEVRAFWDAEARRWWAESDDIPGLVTEATNFDELVERVMAVAPELLAVNSDAFEAGEAEDVPVHMVAERTEVIRRLEQ
jgi:predicted RNase H-like HicB family nuclease